MEQSLIPFNDVQSMGSVIAKSGLFGVKTVDQAVALMLIAQAEGKHPATAAQEYHVIQGRASLKADQMLSRFQHAGGSIKWIKRTDAEASAEFSHPQGGTLSISWTMERAKKAELSGKENWKKYPAQMLSARVISEGVRAVYPAACGSFYTPEEVQDSEPIKNTPIENAQAIDEPKAEIVQAVKRTEKALEASPKPAADVQAVLDGKPFPDARQLLDQIDGIEMLGTIEELQAWWNANKPVIDTLKEAKSIYDAVRAAKQSLKNKSNKQVAS